MKKKVKDIVETFWEGKAFYWFLEFMSNVMGCGNLLLGKIKLGPVRQKILGIRYRVGYECHFRHLRLKEAYRYRIHHFAAMCKGQLAGGIEESDRYLRVIDDGEVRTFIGLSKVFDACKNGSKSIGNKDLFPQSSSRASLGKLLYCGPGRDIHKMKWADYDFVVFNKPPPEYIQISSEKIILVLNHQWPMTKPKVLLAWLEKNPDAGILSPVAVGDAISRNEVFQEIPKFPLNSSLMGLQRTLCVLNYCYTIERLDVFGFNFSLSDKPYSAWYPSLIVKNYGDMKKGILESNLYHDFLLNLLYTRKFINTWNFVQGDILDICSNNVEKIIKKFERIYSLNE